MTRRPLHWPASTATSLLAALTAWVALWSWAGFVERPGRFLLPALGGCLLVAGTGLLLRATGLRAVPVLLGQLGVLLVWATRRWAPAEAVYGWLPGPEAWAVLEGRLAQGVEAAQSYAAPVPEAAPQIYLLLVLAGVGAALVTDFLACGLRRVPAAGLPLLAVYTAPLGILGSGMPWWGFVAGAVAFLFLLAAEEGRRLGGWGRRLSPAGDRVVDTLGSTVVAESLRPATRRIGFTATALAVVVPLVVPTLDEGIVLGPGAGSGGGGGTVTISNPMVDLKRDLTRGQNVELLRVTTSDPDPSYLRTSVLDAYDGETWRPTERDIPGDQQADGALPVPPGLSGGVMRRQVDYRLEATEELRSIWLPTPYPLASITAPGDWRYDVSTLDFVSADEDQTTAGLAYRLTALELEPRPAALANAGPAPADVAERYTELPDDLSVEVRELARQVTAGLPSQFDQAVALQRWFRDVGGFSYSLDRRPGNGSDELVAFLLDGPDAREGYCEQFAAAMAVMARTLDIPARVAVGFLRPRQVEGQRDSFVFRAHDLHAWPELYFQGAGWIRFEPTPPDRAAGVPGYTAGQAPADDPLRSPEQQDPRADRPDPARPERGPDGAAAPGASGGDAGTSGPAAPLLVLGLLAALAAAPRAARTWVRRRRWAAATSPAGRAEAAWQELRASAVDLGLPWDDTVTLRQRARDLAACFGRPSGTAPDDDAPQRGLYANLEASRALERLVHQVERARFARTPEPVPSAAPATGPAGSGDPAADVAACVAALHDGADRGRRFRARWLPLSLLGPSAGRRQRGTLQVRLSEPGVDRVG